MDHFTSTEADAGNYARAHAEADDDRPSASDLASEGVEGTYDAYYRGPDAVATGGIRCAHCKARHASVADVKWCRDLFEEAHAEAQAEQAAERASEIAFARAREAQAENGTWFGPQTIADTWGDVDYRDEPPF
jgi:hypothetical protein